MDITGNFNSIKRRLSTNPKLKSYYINNEKVNKKSYIAHIMKTVFNVYSEKPTIRKLAPKFLRTNQHRMLHTVKFDNTRNVSDSDISTVFLYLFNFNDTEILSKRHKLKTSINKYKKRLISFNGVIKDEKIIGSIGEIRKEINKLEDSLLSTDKNIDKIELVNRINKVDDDQNSLADKILILNLKTKNIVETNEILRDKEHHYLIDELRSIYDYASIKIESALNDYKESLAFHNQLLNTKKEFISDGLEELQRESHECSKNLQELKIIKNNLYKELKSKKKIEELSDTVRNIGELNNKLARYSAIIEQRNTIESNLDDTNMNLNNISSQLEKELNNVNIFEEFLIKNFNYYTKEFYETGYNFSLNLDNDKGECSPSVDEIESNSEGGLKRLEVVLFDMSYIKTVCEKNAYRPNFVLHDSIDEIDIEHITKMFEESSKLSGQHILSMLSDKLPDSLYQKHKTHIILELSQDDKFFRV